MTALARFAKSVGMTGEAWQRHANPCNVYTRFAAIPTGILALRDYSTQILKSLPPTCYDNVSRRSCLGGKKCALTGTKPPITR